MTSSAEHPANRGVDVALAEYDALRQEIVSTRQIQAGFVGLGFTAIGVIFTFALDASGDRRLLVAVPAVALVVELLVLGATYRIHLQGRYIRDELWPYLMASTGYQNCWESTKTGSRKSVAATMAAAGLADGSVLLLMLLSSITALVMYGDVDGRSALGGMAVLMALACAIGVGRATRSDRKGPGTSVGSARND